MNNPVRFILSFALFLFLLDLAVLHYYFFADRSEAMFRYSSALFFLGKEEKALELFSPHAFSEEQLSVISAKTPEEAYFLSEILRLRNGLEIVAEILEPHVKLPLEREGKYSRSESKAADSKRGEKDETDSKNENPSVNELILRRYGDYCLYSGRFEEAVRIADALLAADPEDPLALNLKGAALLDQGETGKAYPIMLKAFKLRPRERRIAGNLASIYLLTGSAMKAKTLQPRLKTEFPSRAWRGSQGNSLVHAGEAWLQGGFLPGPTVMQLVARGTPAGGQWPVLELWINGIKVSEKVVDSEIDYRYTLEFNLRRGPNRIAIRFSNDTGAGDEQCSLFIGSGGFRPVLFEKQMR